MILGGSEAAASPENMKSSFNMEGVPWDIGNYFSALVQDSDDAIISKDLHGVILTWNKGAQQVFGYTADEAVGKPIRMLIPEERQSEENAILDRIQAGERVDHFETVRRRKDGAFIDVSLTISPIRNAGGQIVGASKIARDITQRKRESMLQRRFAAIVESSDDAIISKDLNGIIQSWNAGAERIFGYTAAEIVGQPVQILMPPERKNEETEILARIRRGERVEHYETVRRRKDGTLIDISLTISPILGPFGDVIGASKISRDITERKRSELALARLTTELNTLNADLEKRVAERTESLKAAVAQMQEFSYTVSHDLRSPVRSIQGFATAILEDYGPSLDANVRDLIERIQRSALRMEKLIQDVLAYSRISSSKIECGKVDMDILIRELIKEHQEFQKPLAIIDIKSPLRPVLANEALLTQAITNLFGNSVKFVARGKTPCIEVWTEPQDKRIRLWVKDNGLGIQPEFQSRAFGIFERLHPDLNYEGTGIGLAIVRRAAEKMGGGVGVVSDGANGCSFWMDLPPAT